MSCKVLRSGGFSTIQDMGRSGLAAYGVPKSGVMDQYAAKLANLLVGNQQNEAVIEFTLVGDKLSIHKATNLAITGLEAQFFINDQPKELNQRYQVKQDDIVELKRITKGARAYLAVSGGFQSQVVFDSRSMYEGITLASTIKKNDEINFTANQTFPEGNFASIKFDNTRYKSKEIQVFPGPEYELLSETEKQILLDKIFSISKNNSRMAYQMKESLTNNLKPILTQPVLPGTVQLTPDGTLIVLMRDCQTTGGYPRVLQLSQEAINKLSQKKMNDEVVFSLLK